MEAALKMEDVYHTYQSSGTGRDPVRALTGLTFQVPLGSVYTLLGPNGAGKTSAIRILSTLLIPTSGRAWVCGLDVVSNVREVRTRIGVVLGGDRGLYPRLSVRDNLLYFAALDGIRRSEAARRADELCDKFGLRERRGELVQNLSRGMKQRVHLSRSLLADPPVLILDEPTIGLDPGASASVRDVIAALKDAGKAILLTTHHMIEADILSQRIGVLDRGKLYAEGTPAEIRKHLSNIVVVEMELRRVSEDVRSLLGRLPCVVRSREQDVGYVRRVSVHAKPHEQLREQILALVASCGVESMTIREPTLEEAFLDMFGSRT